MDISNQPNSIRQIKPLIGQTCFVDFPYFKEAIIEGIEDEVAYYEIDKQTRMEREIFHQDPLIFKKQVNYVQQKFLSGKGMNVGPVKFVLYVRTFLKMQENADGSTSKVFSDSLKPFPFQTMVTHLISKDPRHKPLGPLPFTELYPLKMEVLYLGTKCYGCKGVIQDYLGKDSHGKDVFLVNMEKCLKPGRFGKEIAKKAEEEYFSLYDVARGLDLDPVVLAKITADVYFEPGRHNLGIPIKFSTKQQQVLGYTRNVETGNGKRRWEFSRRAIELIKEYKEKFPLVFYLIKTKPENKFFNVEDLVETKPLVN